MTCAICNGAGEITPSFSEISTSPIAETCGSCSGTGKKRLDTATLTEFQVICFDLAKKHNVRINPFLVYTLGALNGFDSLTIPEKALYLEMKDLQKELRRSHGV